MRVLAREPTVRADHECEPPFTCGVDARAMQPNEPRYETENALTASPGITIAGRVLRQRKRTGATFESAWQDALRDVPPDDRRMLTWAQDTLRDAYENRGHGPVDSLLVAP